jgi:Protein of unknwon function (DUF3310)
MIPTNIEEVFQQDQEANDLLFIRGVNPMVSKANDKQIAGNHYKQFKGHEPWDVVMAWELGYLDGTALKYISRWRHKGGVDDLKKAIHFLEKLVELEEKKNNGLSGIT